MQFKLKSNGRPKIAIHVGKHDDIVHLAPCRLRILRSLTYKFTLWALYNPISSRSQVLILGGPTLLLRTFVVCIWL